jgi:hypothetical protein
VPEGGWQRGRRLGGNGGGPLGGASAERFVHGFSGTPKEPTTARARRRRRRMMGEEGAEEEEAAVAAAASGSRNLGCGAARDRARSLRREGSSKTEEVEKDPCPGQPDANGKGVAGESRPRFRGQSSGRHDNSPFVDRLVAGRLGGGSTWGPS